MSTGSGEKLNIDWDRDICRIEGHSVVVHKNKVYVIGGSNSLVRGTGKGDPEGVANPVLRVIDLTRSVSNIGSKDTTASITLNKYVNDIVPTMYGGHVFIGESGLYMFGGWGNFVDKKGEAVNRSTPRNAFNGQLWRYDPSADTWESPGFTRLGANTPMSAVTAFDEDNQIGWIYGGMAKDENFEDGERFLRDLISFDLTTSPYPFAEVVNTINGEDVGNRRSGEMVYIGGLGKAGILVLIGGMNGDFRDDDERIMVAMHKVHVYDIHSRTWFVQETSTTTGTFPTRRLMHCAVAISAQDRSSHNIYIYGGLSADPAESIVLSDVWVLSLPSFTWIKVSAEREEVKVFLQKCVLLENHYMFTYGGQIDNMDPERCHPEYFNQGMKLFDLSSLQWTTEFEFMNGQRKYQVPSRVYNLIGGGPTGGATITRPIKDPIPSPDGIFDYQQTSESGSGQDKSSPSPGVIAGCTLGGIALGVVLVLAFLYFTKRRRQKHDAQVANPLPVQVANPLPVQVSMAGAEHVHRELGGTQLHEVP